MRGDCAAAVAAEKQAAATPAEQQQGGSDGTVMAERRRCDHRWCKEEALDPACSVGPGTVERDAAGDAAGDQEGSTGMMTRSTGRLVGDQ
ncbi:hypothetical protein Scep_009866 [Stephania cephalantha]|uniref:Uncharacterized protein n=1 Tax=Stephania cephalantha TaxID=152367 RepID=A0AAP0PGK0_9MAGN